MYGSPLKQFMQTRQQREEGWRVRFGQANRKYSAKGVMIQHSEPKHGMFPNEHKECQKNVIDEMYNNQSSTWLEKL